MPRIPRQHGAEHLGRIQMIAFLGGLSLFLSTIEYLFPKPVPFFRLGLANLPILLSLGVLGFREIFLLSFLKVLGQGLINGTLASYVFLFSLGGTLASVLVMYGTYRIFPRSITYIGISLAGALASNLVQAGLSLTIIFGQTAWVIVPYFLGMGTATGFVMGWFAQVFARQSRWFGWFVSEYGDSHARLPGWPVVVPVTPEELRSEAPVATDPSDSPPLGKKSPRFRWSSRIRSWRREVRSFIVLKTDPRLFFVTGLVGMIAFFLEDQLIPRLLQVAVLGLIATGTGKKIRVSYFLTLFITITAFHVLQPSGRVIWEVFGLRVTQGALRGGAYKALTLIGFVFLSLGMVQPHLNLPGVVGRLLTRLFSSYEAINDHRRKIRSRRFIPIIDGVLFSSYEKVDEKPDPTGAGSETYTTPLLVWIALLGMHAVLWIFLFM